MGVALPLPDDRRAPAARLPARLRKAGLRLTAPRLEIFKALRQSRSHPTAEELYRSVRRRLPSISRNTVYLTLETLKKIGETSELWIDREAARFEPNPARHDHAVCVRCKKVEDLFPPVLQNVGPPRGLEARFRVLSYRVDFFGLCRVCRRSHKRG